MDECWICFKQKSNKMKILKSMYLEFYKVAIYRLILLLEEIVKTIISRIYSITIFQKV